MTNEERYTRFNLCREMMETPALVAGFDASRLAFEPADGARLLLTGEGSSRLLPAKQARAAALREGWPVAVITEGANQAGEYDSTDYEVWIASNSGRTAEAIRLAQRLGPSHTAAVVATPGSPLGELCGREIILNCGKEQAVAATKSVVEQTLVYQALARGRAAAAMPRMAALSTRVDDALRMPIAAGIVERIARAPVIYFAGRNDGVAEELALKTNEITRKRSAFLEGTFAVHGVEEVMSPDDVVIVVEPFESDDRAFDHALRQGVGLDVVAIASRETPFETIPVPGSGELDGIVQLACGWNLLVEVGLALGVDLDHPLRARKVGNEHAG